MKLFIGVIIVAIIVFILLLASSFMSMVDIEKQPLDILQGKINGCNILPDDGSIESPRAQCAYGLVPEIIQFCEKNPNSVVLANSSCADILESVVEFEQLDLSLIIP